MDFSADGILKRLKTGLKHDSNQMEGGFVMDNLLAVSEELARFHAMLIMPLKEEIAIKKEDVATSGNERHYVQWAKEVTDGDGKKVVGNARAYGVRDGSGVVYLAIISPSAAAPDEAAVKLVEEYIHTQRPVGAKPVITAAQAVGIMVNAVIEVKDGFDLDTITEKVRAKIQEYFTETAFQKTAATLNYYRIGTIISSVDGVKEIIQCTLNGQNDSIPANFDEYFTLEGLVVNGSQ